MTEETQEFIYPLGTRFTLGTDQVWTITARNFSEGDLVRYEVTNDEGAITHLSTSDLEDRGFKLVED